MGLGGVLFLLSIRIDLSRSIKRRVIPKHIKVKMEESLHDEELTKALNEDVKPNSAPGIDGFSIVAADLINVTLSAKDLNSFKDA